MFDASITPRMAVIFPKLGSNRLRDRSTASTWKYHSALKAAGDGTLWKEEPKDGEAVITKHRYDAFIDTDFDLVLRSKRIRTLAMTGVTTNCCVESTARHGFMRDYHIVLVRDCTAAYSNKLYEATLENIDRLFGQVVSSEELLTSWD